MRGIRKEFAMNEATRRKHIKKYVRQLKGIAAHQQGETKTVVTMLIDRLAYLDELQEETIVSGVVVAYDNGGGQKGVRVSHAVNVYTAYAKQFTASVKQLQSFLDNAQEDEDALQDFAAKYTR